MSSHDRMESPIQRSGRSQGENQARSSQPGSYRPQWKDDLTDPPKGIRPPAYSSLDQVPEDLKARAYQKQKWVARFVEEGCPRGKLMPYATVVAEAHGIDEEDMPAYTTLRDWAHQYRHWDVLGLVDRVRSDAGGSRTVTGRNRYWLIACLIGAKHGATQAWRFIQAMIPEGEPVPSKTSVWREVQRFKRDNPHLMVFVQQGKTGFRNRLRLALPGTEVPPGSVWGIDSTVSDLWVRVRNGTQWKPVRPVLTVIEDLGSRAALTFNLSLSPLDSEIIRGVVRKVVQPDSNHFGLPTLPLPEEIVVDRGPEYLGAFGEELARHGVRLSMAIDPEDNGSVERVIGTITTEVFASEVGYSKVQTPFNPYLPPRKDDRKNLSALKYEPERCPVPVEQLMTLGELEAKLNAWATVYNARSHPDLRADSAILAELIELSDALTGDVDGIIANERRAA